MLDDDVESIDGWLLMNMPFIASGLGELDKTLSYVGGIVYEEARTEGGI